MSVYNDIAKDAGYASGTEENDYLARILKQENCGIYLLKEKLQWCIDYSLSASAFNIKQVVYFIEGAEECVRIGISADLHLRYKNLQAGSPKELVFLKIVPGDQRLEELIHALLYSTLVHGSWYRKSAAMLQLIRYLPDSNLYSATFFDFF